MPKEREDVEATLEQVTTPDVSQQKKKWRAIDCIAGSTLVIEVLLSIIWVIAWVCGYRFEHQLQVYLALVLIILTGGYLALIFCPIFKKDDDPRWFHARILSSGIVGGSYAFLLPVVMSLPEGNVNSGGAAALRQAILLATGGLIALIALGETRRKNDNDREAAENLRAHQENMLIQQKEQFEANSFKERKAERRERYTKAVEQLGDEKAPVRMGGVYTFVGLVDEWLEEESIEKYEDRLKEGQVIINNLCAYIRSPFTLASRYDELSKDNPISEGIYKDNQQKFYSDKAELKAEADVRLGIIQEIHDRIQVPDKNTPGAWSDFEYDFSGSTFFYPIDLTNSYYAKPINFSGSTYEGGANFSDSTYQGWADFSDSTYQGEANFNDSSYKGGAYFSASSYKGWADFTRSTYQGWADFSDSSYKGGAYFSDSTYQDEAYFSDSTYQGWANFSDSTYQDWANFSDSTYQDEVYFHSSTYKALAYFRRSTYQALADFRRSTYQDVADFSGSIFYQKVYFGVDGDNSSFSRFTDCAPQFYDETNHKNTLFGSPNNDFTVENGRGYPIYRNLEGLPLGCKFLTSEQKEYPEYKFQEIDETKNKLREIKDPKEKAELLKKLQALNEKLHEWREEATTVNVEGTAPEEKNN
ncbi:pentapeptide repeat-containing protein [Rothia dentocariosa]|uniref:pentapeptide repeat-containing protein n=1 Tax=Rothia dentocariosa TaxID=2047 RepID=UPI000AB21671|nr:hypothetical protein [Rothia dentocariosa]